MDENKILSLIPEGNWDELLEVLKDNEKVSKLINDTNSLIIFNQYFMNELINAWDGKNEDYIIMITAIHGFHKSNSYDFTLTDLDFKKLIVQMVKITQNVNYAYEYPDHSACVELIERHETEVDKIVRNTEINHQLKNKFDVTEHESLSDESHVISIFKSPQELDLFIAAEKVFVDSILLPNAALSTVINNNVLNGMPPKEIGYFLSTTVDLVIVDYDSQLPTHFIELDSSYHDDPKQKMKDELKNKLINEAGYKLIRVRQRNNDANDDDFKILLEREKNNSKLV